jgi:hypothetical protein
MATTTTNYGFDIPQSTDLVKDGATAIATLGQDIDTAMNTALGTKKAGMVLLNTTSFSGVSSQSINDVFSATYTNYQIVWNLKASAGPTDIQFRLRVAGADITGANYDLIGQVNGPATVNINTLNQTTLNMFPLEATNNSIAILNLGSPFATEYTSGLLTADRTWDGYNLVSKMRYKATTSATGFTFYPAANNITGSVSVYGWNK